MADEMDGGGEKEREEEEEGHALIDKRMLSACLPVRDVLTSQMSVCFSVFFVIVIVVSLASACFMHARQCLSGSSILAPSLPASFSVLSPIGLLVSSLLLSPVCYLDGSRPQDGSCSLWAIKDSRPVIGYPAFSYQ